MEQSNQAIVITNTDIYRAIVIKHAINFYRLHHVKVNRAYTPKAMMDAARQITGATLAPRDYLGAEEALEKWLKERKEAKDAKALEVQNGG